VSYGNGYGNRQGGNGYRGSGGGYGNRSAAPRPSGQAQGQRKDNSGSMRRNHDKQNEKQPDFKGSVMIAGRLYFLSAWDNGDYYKLAVTPADEANQSRPQSAPARGQGGGYQQGGHDPSLNDDVPF
jgi:hypothetical protein